MYSAVKISGKKLYELARKGEMAERKPRRVVIESIRLLTRNEAYRLGCAGEASEETSGETSRFYIEVKCSKGTYIRTLCADIGAKLGCGAAMGALTRTRSGLFFLQNAVKIETLREAAQHNRLSDYVLPIEGVLPYPRAVVGEAVLKQVLSGNAFSADNISSVCVDFAKIWLYTPDNCLIGLFAYDAVNNQFRPEVML
jgi:tRNA pseudouridine55 synthase